MGLIFQMKKNPIFQIINIRFKVRTSYYSDTAVRVCVVNDAKFPSFGGAKINTAVCLLLRVPNSARVLIDNTPLWENDSTYIGKVRILRGQRSKAD